MEAQVRQERETRGAEERESEQEGRASTWRGEGEKGGRHRGRVMETRSGAEAEGEDTRGEEAVEARG